MICSTKCMYVFNFFRNRALDRKSDQSLRRSLVGCWGCLPTSNGRGHSDKTILKPKLFTGRRELSRDWRDRHPTPRLLSAVGCTTPLLAASHEVRHCFFCCCFFYKIVNDVKRKDCCFRCWPNQEARKSESYYISQFLLSVQLPMPPTSHKVQTLVD